MGCDRPIAGSGCRGGRPGSGPSPSLQTDRKLRGKVSQTGLLKCSFLDAVCALNIVNPIVINLSLKSAVFEIQMYFKICMKLTWY